MKTYANWVSSLSNSIKDESTISRPKKDFSSIEDYKLAIFKECLAFWDLKHKFRPSTIYEGNMFIRMYMGKLSGLGMDEYEDNNFAGRIYNTLLADLFEKEKGG